VVLEQPGTDPIVLDLGTGLRAYGETWPADRPFRGTALVTHLHWDHVQGLPFFAPILRAGGHLDIHGPVEDGIGLAEAFDQFMRPPFFPVQVGDLPGEVVFHDTSPGTFRVGDAEVTVASVPHVGRTNGYRIETGGVSVAYVSDHQQPALGRFDVAPEVVDLCEGVDLLIHDAQYDAADFARKSTWGHCTVDYAVAVAATAGAKRLVLFHHDPAHCDSALEVLLGQARTAAEGTSLEEVILAAEGQSIVLRGDVATSRTLAAGASAAH
jgi:phosphoribosyl 1,2-cyclic phosphodiesterase